MSYYSGHDLVRFGGTHSQDGKNEKIERENWDRGARWVLAESHHKDVNTIPHGRDSHPQDGNSTLKQYITR